MGTVAIVTGANRGLGKGTARELGKRGHVVVIGSRSLEAGEIVAKELRDDGIEAVAVELDVSSDASVAALRGFLEERDLLDVEILVNNAGAILESGWGTGVADLPAAVALDAFNINTLGAYRMIQAVAPLMKGRGGGAIVNVSSGMGQLAEMGGGTPAYRMSKSALNALTKITHAEWRSAGIRVNSVCPGWVKTDMGGPSATRELAQGVSSILWAATLPKDGPSGGFYRDGKSIAW